MTSEHNFINHREYVKKYMLDKMGIESLSNLSLEDKTRLTKEFIICIMSECDEILREVPWKFWKNYSDFNFSEEKLKFELIDLQHFVNDLFMIWDMEPEEINSLFAQKLKINVGRQENNY